jgi:short-subunit dehydrogenase
MIENKSIVIVNVTSGARSSSFPNLFAYCASKFCIIVKEVANNNVKVISICNGGVDTKMIEEIVDNRYILSNRNLKPVQVAKKI